MKNIVFIGMPGSGKSTVGKILATKMKYKFCDLDEYLESKSGNSISHIFSEYGELYFRNLEYECVKEIKKWTGTVVATGGGVVEKRENMENMRGNSIVIFLHRELEEIMKLDHSKRPLLKDISNLKKLYERRINLYKNYCDIMVENNGPLEKVVDEIKKLILNYMSNEV